VLFQPSWREIDGWEPLPEADLKAMSDQIGFRVGGALVMGGSFSWLGVSSSAEPIGGRPRARGHGRGPSPSTRLHRSRAEAERGEIGTLTDGFNNMLDAIQDAGGTLRKQEAG